jgi:hypothetical protein
MVSSTARAATGRPPRRRITMVYGQQPPPQPTEAMAYYQNLDLRLRALEARVGGGFFKRAFSTWGYWFVAQFMISLVIWVIAIVFGLIFGLGIAGLSGNLQ